MTTILSSTLKVYDEFARCTPDFLAEVDGLLDCIDRAIPPRHDYYREHLDALCIARQKVNIAKQE